MDRNEKDLELIQDILEGKIERFRELVDRHKNYVFTLTSRILSNPEEAEEAAQDVFMKAYKNLAKFNQTAKFTTWLYRIAFNTAVSYSRKKRVPTTDIEEIRITKYESRNESMEQQDRERYIDLAMQRLLPMDATLLTLFYLEEQSIDEISQATRLKKNAIKVKLFRARKRMADEMQVLLRNETSSMRV